MDNDIKNLLLVILVTLGFFTYGGFYFGRKIERFHWEKVLPAEMNKLCMECAGIKPRGIND